MNENYVTCQCSDPDHLLFMAYDEDEPEWGLDVGIRLTPYLSFPKRLRVAFLYLFGLESKKYQYSETILDEKSADSFVAFVEKWKDDLKK